MRKISKCQGATLASISPYEEYNALLKKYSDDWESCSTYYKHSSAFCFLSSPADVDEAIAIIYGDESWA